MTLKNIKRLCDEHDISFWALERSTGIGNGVIAKWEGKSPRIDTLQKVADYFGVTVDDLLAQEKDTA